MAHHNFGYGNLMLGSYIQLTSTLLPAELMMQLESELQDLSLEFVERGTTCLVPCITRLVKYLEVRYNAAAVATADPTCLLRPSGARFSPSGLLVAFGLPDG